MKKSLKTFIKCGALSAILLSAASIAKADSGDVIEWLNDNFVLGTPYLFPETMKANSQNVAANDSVNTDTYSTTQALINQTMMNENSGGIMMKSASLVPSLGKKDPAQSVQQTGPIFNISTLMSQMGIDKDSDQEKQMQATIAFLSGQATPIPTLDKNTARANTAAVQQYLAGYGSYIASQSVGLNVLYSLLNERIRQPGLGEGISSNNNMSPLELEHYMATRRLSVEGNKSDWIKKMSNATPAEVSKEALIMQAEQNYQLYQISQKLDNLNATMATMLLLQNQAIANQFLQMQRSAAISSVSAQ